MDSIADEIKREKIRRARLAGPDCVTREATDMAVDPLGDRAVWTMTYAGP